VVKILLQYHGAGGAEGSIGDGGAANEDNFNISKVGGVGGTISSSSASTSMDHSELLVKNATTCLRTISGHTAELANMVIENGGLKALKQILDDGASGAVVNNGCIYAAVKCITNLAKFSADHAEQVVNAMVLKPLSQLLRNGGEKLELYIRGSIAVCLSTIGGHNAKLCASVGNYQVLELLHEEHLRIKFAARRVGMVGLLGLGSKRSTAGKNFLRSSGA
jgi:hypothetical protein